MLFLKHAELRLRPGQAGRRVLSCKMGDSLFEVLHKLIAHRIHRIWFVDAKNICIGVVSLTDIFTQIQKQ